MHTRSVLILSAFAACAAPAFAAETYTPDYFVQYQASTAMDMINHLPDFSFYGGSGGRGMSGTPGNVLINGKRPSSKSDSLSKILGRIPATGVLRIDVITGGASGIDMGGQAMVANVILKDISLASGSVNTWSTIERDGSVFPSAEGNYSLRRHDQSIDASLAWTTSPDNGQGRGERIVTRTGQAPTQTTLDTQGSWESKSFKLNYARDVLGGELHLNNSYSPSVYRSRGRYDGDTRSQADSDNAERRLEQGMDFSHSLGQTSNLDVKALYRSTDSAYRSHYVSDSDASQYRSATKATEQILVTELSWQPAGNLVIRGGVEHTVNTNDTHSVYQASGAPSTNAVGVQEQRLESQLSSAWQASDAVSVDAGVRVEHSSLAQRSDAAGPREFVYPKPRLLLTWTASPSLQLRLRTEREVSQLNFGDFISSVSLSDATSTAGNPDLVPAKTWRSEGSVEYRFAERGSAALTYSHAQITDVVDRVPVRTASGTQDAAGNIGEGTSDSLSAHLNLPTDSWLLRDGLLKFSTTGRSSRVTDPTTLAARRLSGEQALSWRVEFSQELPQYRANWGMFFDNGWSNESFQVAERDASSGSGWVKAYLNYRPARKMSVSLELNNLASRGIAWDRTHYAGDRQSGSIDFIEHNLTRTQPFAVLSLRQDW